MSRFDDFTDALLPDEKNPAAMRRYRMRLALVACSAWLMLVFVVLPALFTGLPMLGQVVWAQDGDERIQEAVAPVAAQVTRLEKQIGDVDQKTDALLLSQLRAELRDTRRLQCKAIKADDPERKTAYGKAMEGLQEQYKAIAG